MTHQTIATIGWSANPDAIQAGREASKMALQKHDSPRPRLACVFGSSWFNQPQMIRGIRSVLGDIALLGGTTAGEITPQGPTSHSCVIALIACDKHTIGIGVGNELNLRPREAGQQVAHQAMKQLDQVQRTGFIFFGDGMAAGYTDIVRGIQEVLGTEFLITGAMMGDDMRFQQSFQYYNDQVMSHAIVGMLIGDSLKIGVGIEHGFAPISKPRQISRSRTNVLYELDNQPAASVYEEYFGAALVKKMHHEGLTQMGLAYPLGIQQDTEERTLLLRNILAFREDGSLLCSGDVPQGGWTQLMLASRELALEAARKAAKSAIEHLRQIACVLVFDSAMRRRLLGAQHAGSEIAQIRQIVGHNTPMAGCYTYGEQAPLGNSTRSVKTSTQAGSVLVIALGN